MKRPIKPRTDCQVVQIGEARIARGLRYSEPNNCRHLKLTYCSAERRVWCQSCDSEVDVFDAFLILVAQYSRAMATLDRRKTEVEEAEAKAFTRIAAKKLDAAWRKAHKVPCCPHCLNGLLPEDFNDKPIVYTSKEFEQAKRERDKDV